MDGGGDDRMEQQLRGGDDGVLGALFESHRERLSRMVAFRLDVSAAEPAARPPPLPGLPFCYTPRTRRSLVE